MMMGRHNALLLFALLVTCLLAVSTDARKHQRTLTAAANRRANFDFFLLVRQWPATFCNDHSCSHDPPAKYAFTVHGLWPQRRDGSWPEYCDPSSHLDMDNLDDLLPDLERAWPSWSSDDETFWDHEWSRHGTCAAAVVGGQHSFFKAVLQLHNKLNVQDALSRANIHPSNSARYPVQDIKDALEDAYGVMPHVTCDNRGALAEVWMCLNKKLRPIDCVDDPHPHAQYGRLDSEGELASGPTPARNNNCNMVVIPKLRRHHQVEKADAADTPRQGVRAAAQPTVDNVTTSSVQEEQMLAAAQALAAGTAGSAGAAPHPNQHLPLLAAMVAAVVAAAVVAAVVAFRQQCHAPYMPVGCEEDLACEQRCSGGVVPPAPAGYAVLPKAEGCV